MVEAKPPLLSFRRGYSCGKLKNRKIKIHKIKVISVVGNYYVFYQAAKLLPRTTLPQQNNLLSQGRPLGRAIIPKIPLIICYLLFNICHDDVFIRFNAFTNFEMPLIRLKIENFKYFINFTAS